MGSLSEYVYLRGVDAKIIADESWSKHEWRLDITMEGPDLRYNIARTELYASDVLYLVSLLEKALKKMNKLNVISFSGTYQKQIGDRLPRNGIEVSVYGPYGGEMKARIQMRTGTYVFSRFLDEDDTVKWINELRKAPEIGNQLVKTLKTIT